jgi:hypothetical protein
VEASTGDAASLFDAGPHAVGTIYSGVPWFDTGGKLVNAHGVGFIRVDDTFYMVGEQRSGADDSYSGAPINAEDTFTGVSMYATKDFANWTFVGTVVEPVPGTILAAPYYGERPKIIYNAYSGQYRIYIKMLDYTGDPPVYVGQYAVLTSDTVSGPYTYFGTLGSGGASDFQVFQDADGSEYLAQAGGPLYRFSVSGLSLTTQVGDNAASGEGVSLFKAGSTYFWQSSQGTYWHANDNAYATADSLTGAWTTMGYFCPAGTETWDSQDTAVLPIQGASGTTYVYVGDRWVNGDLPASTLVVQPMAISGSTESIAAYNPVWSLDVTDGTWSAVSPAGVSVNDDATGTGPNQFNYDGSWSAGPCAGCSGRRSFLGDDGGDRLPRVHGLAGLALRVLRRKLRDHGRHGERRRGRRAHARGARQPSLRRAACGQRAGLREPRDAERPVRAHRPRHRSQGLLQRRHSLPYRSRRDRPVTARAPRGPFAHFTRAA